MPRNRKQSYESKKRSAAARARLRRALETPEQKARRRARAAEYARMKRRNETVEQKRVRRLRLAEYEKTRREKETFCTQLKEMPNSETFFSGNQVMPFNGFSSPAWKAAAAFNLDEILPSSKNITENPESVNDSASDYENTIEDNFLDKLLEKIFQKDERQNNVQIFFARFA